MLSQLLHRSSFISRTACLVFTLAIAVGLILAWERTSRSQDYDRGEARKTQDGFAIGSLHEGLDSSVNTRKTPAQIMKQHFLSSRFHGRVNQLDHPTVFNAERDLWAWDAEEFVYLMWEPVVGPDRYVYAIYRRPSADNAWVELSAVRTASNKFLDSQISTSDEILEYRVEAFTERGAKVKDFSAVIVDNNHNRISPRALNVSPAAAQSHDKDNVTSNSDFVNSQSMTVQQIQDFLSSKGSCLASYSTQDIDTNTRTAAQIIYNASQNFFNYSFTPTKINPQVILTKLQVEQMLITTPTCSQSRLDHAMGYGDSSFNGFATQIDRATAQFRRNWQNIVNTGNAFGWGVSISKQTCDFVLVRPQNEATADLYAYTDNVGEQWGGNFPNCKNEGPAGGNYLYYAVFYNQFGFGLDGGNPILNINTLSPAATEIRDWGTSVNYTITVVDNNGASVTGANVIVTDNLRALSTQTAATDSNGQTTYSTTVLSGTTNATYGIAFRANKSGYTDSASLTRQIVVNHVGASGVTMASGWYWPTGSAFDHVNFCNYLGWLGYNSKDHPWHLAQDMCNGDSAGNPVYSIGDGDVILSRTDVGGYGPGWSQGGALIARYQAADGASFTALYGHLDSPHAVGHVFPGDIIGYSNALSKPHVHFAIHPGFDPEPGNPGPWRGYTDSRSNTYGFTDPLPFLNAHPRSNTGTSQPLEGYHDGTTCDKIFGWARDKTHPTSRVNVEIFDGSTKLATVPANEFRSDLLTQGIGDGNYAFNFITPASLKDGNNHNITIRVENSTFQLVNTGQQFNSTCSTAPTASFTINGGGKSITNGQTLTLVVPPGSSASIDFDSSNSQPGAGTINTRQWKLDGANVSTLPRFTYSLGAGTHNVSLDVMNSGGLHDTATGTVVITESSSQAPTIAGINPTSVSPSTFDLTINGTNFDGNAIDQVYFGSSFVGNGQILSRTGSTQIVVREFMSTATLGTYTVKVRNSDGQLSNGKSLMLAQTQTPAPTLNAINPSSTAPSTFDLTINGINFDDGAIDQIYFGSSLVGNGQILSRTSAQIVVRESMSTATPGVYTVKVKNSDGQLSNGLGLTLTGSVPGPVINSVLPGSYPASSNNQTMTINGSNFKSGATLTFVPPEGGSIPSTASKLTFVSSNQISYQFNNANDCGNWSVRVNNPDGQSSSTVAFTVTCAAPSISSVSPSSYPASSNNQTMTINGSSFKSGATLTFRDPQGNSIASSASKLTFISSSQISYQFNNANDPGTWTVKVNNPDGQLSNTVSFTVTAAAPIISNVSPSTYPASGSNQTMTINGSNFQTGATLTFRDPQGNSIASTASKLTFVSSSQISYQFNNANDPGAWTVKVNNPDGQSSNTISFTVTPAAPSISNVSPSTYPASGSNQTMTINGSNFQSGATLTFRDPQSNSIASTASKLTFISSSQISYQFNNGSDRGTWTVKVNNPDGQSSNTVSFTVQ